MNCEENTDISIEALIWGAIRLAVALPLLWWGFTHCEMVQDFYLFFSETLPSLLRLFFFGHF